MNALEWIGVALLGGVGALARVTLDGAVTDVLKPVLRGPARRLVAGILIVNVTGAFLLGLVDGLALTGSASVLVGTAALGAYTTFSTWMLQSQVLRTDGQRLAGAVNVTASLLIGFGAVALGRVIGVAL